jgi:hypothetical protein
VGFPQIVHDLSLAILTSEIQVKGMHHLELSLLGRIHIRRRRILCHTYYYSIQIVIVLKGLTSTRSVNVSSFPSS